MQGRAGLPNSQAPLRTCSEKRCGGLTYPRKFAEAKQACARSVAASGLPDYAPRLYASGALEVSRRVSQDRRRPSRTAATVLAPELAPTTSISKLDSVCGTLEATPKNVGPLQLRMATGHKAERGLLPSKSDEDSITALKALTRKLQGVYDEVAQDVAVMSLNSVLEATRTLMNTSGQSKQGFSGDDAAQPSTSSSALQHISKASTRRAIRAKGRRSSSAPAMIADAHTHAPAPSNLQNMVQGSGELLSRHDELELIKITKELSYLQRCMATLEHNIRRKASLQELAKYMRMDEKVLSELLMLGASARERLIHHNLRLVVSIAKKYGGQGIPLEDLVEAGTQGLQIAIDRYDVSSGYKLSTYATWWIRQHVTRTIINESRLVRLPVNIQELSTKLRVAYMELSRQLGRVPHQQELAAELRLSEKRLGEVQAAMLLEMNGTMSMDCTSQDEDDDPRAVDAERVHNAEAGADDAYERSLSMLSQLDVERTLRALSPQEAVLVKRRFGFDGSEGATLGQLGREKGVSIERIRQVEAKVMTKLRANRNIRGLAEEMIAAGGGGATARGGGGAHKKTRS
mmetsp:Transcript_30961/g.68582  ORF Transcript_30961/g.68582 Transcript_30961/m.68582 type:complete len:574 (-) Transcript_30961:451-2172(-)